MRLYYSLSCPHSASMLQIMEMCNVPCEMVDVEQGPNPPELQGTPALEHDGSLYHGDDAFNVLPTLMQGPAPKPQPSKNSKATVPQNSDCVSLVDSSAVAAMFDCDSVTPRK